MEAYNDVTKEPGFESDSSSDEADEADEADEDPVHAMFKAIENQVGQSKINLRDPGEMAAFADEYRRYLGQSTSEANDRKTLLHLLVDGATDHQFDKYEPLIQLIISKYPDTLKQGDRYRETSLYNAVSKKRNKLIELICNEHPNINSVFEQPCLSDHGTCVHAAIQKGLAPKILIPLVNKASKKVLCHQDFQGRTPLHLAVDYNRCTKEQLQIVEALAKRCQEAMYTRSEGDACHSPYMYHMHTRSKAQADQDQVASGKKKDPIPKRYHKSSKIRHERMTNNNDGGNYKTTYAEELKDPVVPGPSRNFDAQRGEFSAKYTSVNTLSSWSKSAESTLGLDLPRDCKDEDPGSVNCQDSSVKRTAKPTKKKNHGRSKVLEVTTASADAVKDFLMLHCMRTMKTEDAVNFLYGKGQGESPACVYFVKLVFYVPGSDGVVCLGKEICFDLCDQLSLEITEEQIDKGYAPLEFESVLQYVAFPNLRIKKTPLRYRQGKRAIPDGNGRDDMIVLFQFLRRKKVERIVRVIVADKDEIAHSDEAVENALGGLEVEIWDWQKFDICTETIATAAPDVEEIHLYWSGNNAVLWSWSEEEVLKRMKKLQRMHVHTTQGLETAKRTKEDLENFKKRIENYCESVSVESIDEDMSQEHESSNTHTNTEEQQRASRHQWLICMDEFADFMQMFKPPNASYKPIKVALIDDGVDMKEDALHGKVLTGRSFCMRDEEQNLNRSYYVKSGGHGTAMASLICRICPHAKLIVLKLEEYIGPNLERQITAKSAAKYAIEREADIISMSWSIERTDENKFDIVALESAVRDAANNRILMFCAASDGGAVSDRSFPAKSVNELLFKIGAATEEGSKWKWVGDANHVNFIFPGYRVVQERYEAFLKNCKFLTGSSVATAIAAGLAALILDCVQRAALHYEELLHQQRKLSSTQLTPQRDGSEMPPSPRGPEEDLRLQKKMSEVNEAISRAEKVLRRDYDNLKERDNMNQAFCKIGLTDEKYVKVWETFQKGPAGMTDEEKIEIVSKIAQRLKGEDYQDQ